MPEADGSGHSLFLCAFSQADSLILNEMRSEVVFFLNGLQQNIASDQAQMMLTDYLRLVRGLSGTKVVCSEGDCGACTILYARLPREPGAKVSFRAVNSCILMVAQLDGCILVTIEGLKHPAHCAEVQEKLVCHHAAQCGYCTPGIVMALAGALEAKAPSHKLLTEQEAKNALTGNLCRCTGYSPIISGACNIDLKQALLPTVSALYATQATIRCLRKACSQPLWLKPSPKSETDFEVFAPLTTKVACAFLRKNPAARIIGAGTDMGVQRNKRKQRLSQMVSLHLLKGAEKIKVLRTKQISIGTNATIHELRRALKQPLPEFARYLDLFASPQIKNIATVVGNLANASPIGDLAPPLLVLNTEVDIANEKGTRSVALTQFFRSYRKTAVRKGELVSGIRFEIPDSDQVFTLYKISQRKDLDISTINAAFNFRIENSSRQQTISEARIAFGGVAAVPLRLTELEGWLRGKQIHRGLYEMALPLLRQELSPISDLRSTAAYRSVVAEKLLRRFFQSLLSQNQETSHAFA